ncbi:hypothetical protein GALL_521490 [mine drainage metagenome]|uniref:Uncharacterized protein n=1 Tax=mine drainage metagenome TaxID=410659 RepID=A0A1J5PLV1_9ZZZZ
MELGAIERIVHHLALLEQLAVPQIDELLAEMRPHLVAEHVGEVAQQRFLVGRAEQFERPAVDIEHADFTHAARDEFLVHIGEDAEVLHAAGAHVIDEPFHAAEILHPQRDR